MRRHAMVDAVTVVLAVMVGVLLMYGPNAVVRPYGLGGSAVLVVLAVVLWWRRSAPGAVAWIAVLFSTVLVLAEALVPGAVLRPYAGSRPCWWLRRLRSPPTPWRCTRAAAARPGSPSPPSSP
ncbi:hypothetical protein Psuf_021860 [Phytohabitans suffuscus]|uniref:Uncharacterized protein n=1 Tax=Phytohabitans suffuscus TaxID=624315 RepID=A0A6F8YFR3_9ACTN|nr:hypothetical protein [Phytohabitans suffuscus]BCB84873.1 hypothetical protein Psuf_021860 [Phytohabitans suffuscus]